MWSLTHERLIGDDQIVVKTRGWVKLLTACLDMRHLVVDARSRQIYFRRQFLWVFGGTHELFFEDVAEVKYTYHFRETNAQGNRVEWYIVELRLKDRSSIELFRFDGFEEETSREFFETLRRMIVPRGQAMHESLHRLRVPAKRK